MPTKGEEVVARADLLDAQGAAPDRGQRLLDVPAGFDVLDVLVARDRDVRQRRQIELPVGCLRQPVHGEERRGDHVLG